MNLRSTFRLMIKAVLLSALPFCFSAPQLTITETDDALIVKQGEKAILQYNKSLQQAPEGMDPIYARSGYIHPVYTPSGQIATGDFSVKHPHQRGIFNAVPYATFRGEKVDFWNLHDKLGRTEHAKTLSTGSSKDAVSFTVALNHVSMVGDSETVVLRELWHVATRQVSEEVYLFDIESNQTLATEDPLVFNEYRYGGMALRGSNSWVIMEEGETSDCEILTSDGADRENGNHTHPRWISMYGNVDGEIANITVLCHPDNFRFPQAVRIHPSLPYYSFSPMFDGEFSLQPGESYDSKYRYLVTSAKPDPDWIEEQWNAYIK